MDKNLWNKIGNAVDTNQLEDFENLLNSLSFKERKDNINIIFGNAIFCLLKPEIIKFLLENGADPNYPDPNRADPMLLEQGIKCGNMLHCLVAKLSDFYDDGLIVPHAKELLELLIKYNVNINELNDFNSTPLDLAIEFKNKLAEEFLRSHGGKTSKELEENK